MAVRTAYAGAAVAGEVLTAANVNKLPGGWIGYAEVTSSQGSIVSETDITSLTVTVTVGASRRIRVSYRGALATTIAGDTAASYIKEGATTLQSTHDVHMPTTAAFAAETSVVLTPTGGSHTYKIASLRATGTGTIQHTATTATPSYIVVEDIGPAT